ncbi:hypothetical protein Sango_1560900 [Sesamum angolense]|uniref:Uncharacterized protein n=1 Tax=Sesamum angolense TaxID=2727404 RepID=A0AAE1WQ76_9LAMI|nr:hypothetical protein Sango_1560900 [Sesamum angolense]
MVRGKEIHILVDSGSTHSFIDEKVVKALGIKIEPTIPMIVSVANGYRMVSKVICPELNWEIQGFQFSYPLLSTDTLKDKSVDHPVISGLLQKLDDIFQEPQSQPPERNIEHNIELMPDAILKKQPYRYAYGQKTEIENIVRGMIRSGIKWESQSSFTSPVLLVKKKDGG